MRKMTITVVVEDTGCSKMSTQVSKQYDLDAIMSCNNPRNIVTYEVCELITKAAGLEEREL